MSNQSMALEKEDVTALIIAKKREKGLGWSDIASAIGMSPVWTHSAAMGMQAMAADKAAELASK